MMDDKLKMPQAFRFVQDVTKGRQETTHRVREEAKRFIEANAEGGGFVIVSIDREGAPGCLGMMIQMPVNEQALEESDEYGLAFTLRSLLGSSAAARVQAQAIMKENAELLRTMAGKSLGRFADGVYSALDALDDD